MKSALLGVARVLCGQPLAGALDALAAIRCQAGVSIKLDGAQANRGGRDEAIRLGRALVDGDPMSIGLLAQGDVAGIDGRGEIGVDAHGIHGEKPRAVVECRIDDVGVLDGAIQAGGRRVGVHGVGTGQFFVDRDAVLASGAECDGRENLVMAGFAALLDVPIFFGSLQ